MVLFTTYAMFRNKDEARSTVMLNLINQIRNVEWGLVVFDEVHMLPAAQARLAVSSVRAHCKLGLTVSRRALKFAFMPCSDEIFCAVLLT